MNDKKKLFNFKYFWHQFDSQINKNYSRSNNINDNASGM